MTLLIFARGNDGFVIISDRKESDNTVQGNEVQKYYLPRNEEFFLTLAGNGTSAKALFASLATKNVDSINIIPTVQDFVKATYAEFQEPRHVEGFLVIKDGCNFELKTIRISGDKFSSYGNDSGFLTIGDPNAELITKHLVRNINFNRLPCEAVAKRLLASISDVAETVLSVGNLERFGFDVSAFMNSGQIIQIPRYTDTRNRLKISFDLNDSEVFLYSNNNGDKKDG